MVGINGPRPTAAGMNSTPLTVGDRLCCRALGGDWKLPGNLSRNCRLSTGRGSIYDRQPGIFEICAGKEQKDVFGQLPR